MSEQLRRALHDLSTEVSVVDLRDRALATSRRMTRRRRALTAAVAVAVVAVVGGVTAALWPRGLNPTPPPPAETPTPTTTLSESPSPSPSAPVDPLAPVLGEWVSSPRASLPGTAVYLSLDPVAGTPVPHTYRYTVHRLADGVEQVATLGPDVSLTNCSLNIPSVSPDGSKVAMAAGGVERPGESWVDGASLFVTDLTTGASRRLLDNIECVATIWSADSSRILLTTSPAFHR
jgi:Periplasmic component of the Tol biopolymer transport system